MSAVNASGRFVTSGWTFIPGPETFREPLYSTSISEIAEYSPDSIASAILSFPDTSLIRRAEPSWWEWRARWQKEARFIEIGFSLFETEPAFWGGSELKADCLVSDLLALWLTIRSSHPAVWLHSPDGRVYTPDSFVSECV
jgi:hypothetical protein